MKRLKEEVEERVEKVEVPGVTYYNYLKGKEEFDRSKENLEKQQEEASKNADKNETSFVALLNKAIKDSGLDLEMQLKESLGVYEYNIKDRKELSKVLESLDKANIKASIKRGVVEGYRYLLQVKAPLKEAKEENPANKKGLRSTRIKAEKGKGLKEDLGEKRIRIILDNLIDWALEVVDYNPYSVEDMANEIGLTDEEIDELDLRDVIGAKRSNLEREEEEDIEESCKGKKCKKQLKETWESDDIIDDLIERACGEIDEGSELDDAIWKALDEGFFETYDQFVILKEIFDINDLYTKDGESVWNAIDEYVFDKMYGKVSDYFEEKHQEDEDEDIDESKKQECKKKVLEALKNRTFKKECKEECEEDCKEECEEACEKQDEALNESNASYYKKVLKRLAGKKITKENADGYAKKLGISTSKLFDILDDLVSDMYISGNNETLKYTIPLEAYKEIDECKEAIEPVAKEDGIREGNVVTRWDDGTEKELEVGNTCQLCDVNLDDNCLGLLICDSNEDDSKCASYITNSLGNVDDMDELPQDTFKIVEKIPVNDKFYVLKVVELVYDKDSNNMIEIDNIENYYDDVRTREEWLAEFEDDLPKNLKESKLNEILVTKLQKYVDKVKEELPDAVKEAEERLEASTSKAEDYASLSVFWNKVMDHSFDNWEDQDIHVLVDDAEAMMPMPESVHKQFVNLLFGDKIKNIDVLSDLDIYDDLLTTGDVGLDDGEYEKLYDELVNNVYFEETEEDKEYEPSADDDIEYNGEIEKVEVTEEEPAEEKPAEEKPAVDAEKELEIKKVLEDRNTFEFESGDYCYVGYEDGKLFAGSATNAGIMREVEIDYDFDESVDANLDRLYNAVVDKHPEYLDF